MNLASIDLNLLVALEVLLQEQNVTRAAARIGVSQSAMSHSLRRLRELLDDPLLVRTSTGMVPTSRAAELTFPICQALESIRTFLTRPPPFDPATCDAQVRIAMPDLGQCIVLPALIERLRRDAPKLRLSVVGRGSVDVATLESGELDLALVGAGPDSEHVFRQRLFFVRSITIARSGHPTIGSSLGLEQFVTLGHVAVSLGGSGQSNVDAALAERGLQRNVVLRLSSFVAVPWVVAASDMIATIPDVLAHQLTGLLGVRQFATPVPLERQQVEMVWHARMDCEPVQRWFRSVLLEVCAPFRNRDQQGET